MDMVTRQLLQGTSIAKGHLMPSNHLTVKPLASPSLGGLHIGNEMLRGLRYLQQCPRMHPACALFSLLDC